MITATYIKPVTGEIHEVLVLDARKDEGLALVSPRKSETGAWGDGQFWKNAPIWSVEIDTLKNIRLVCWECATEFLPGERCPACGASIHDPISDEQDAEQTRRALADEYHSGTL